MSQSDFQARLDRLTPQNAEQSRLSQHALSDEDLGSPAATRRRLRDALVEIGPAATVMTIGFQALKFVYERYDYLSDTKGIVATIGLVLTAVTLTIVGIVLFARASKRFSANNRVERPAPKRVPSSRAKTLWSLFGLLLGAFACYEMFLANAARNFESENAMKLAVGGVVIASSLVLITSLFLIAGAIWRGRGLARVTVFFWAGGLLTYLAMGLLKVDLSQSEAFAVYLQ